MDADLSLSHLPDGFEVGVVDSSLAYPFVVPKDTLPIVQQVCQYSTDFEKAYGLFSLLQERYSYGKNKRNFGYRSAIEVDNDKQGVCGEMSFVYVTLGLLCGLVSRYARVSVDHKGKPVNHACSAVLLPERWLYVDLAYRRFDIHHKKKRIVSFKEMHSNYVNWRF